MRIVWSGNRRSSDGQQTDNRRKGAFVVLGLFCLIIGMTFVGFSVDLGMINVTKSRMQATADACALAAVKEIQVAIQEIGNDGGDGTDVATATAFATQQAGLMAAKVAELNGLYVDPDQDLRFGKRNLNDDGTHSVQWDTSPFNVVEVTIRKDNEDATAPDAKLDLFFSPLYGDRSTALQAQAAAFIESRDIVAVLDFSGSMNFDSLPFTTGLSQSAVRDNIDDIWDDLQNSNVTFSDSPDLKFPSEGFGLIDSLSGEYYTSTSSESVYNHLELASESGDAFYESWPIYQSGYYYIQYNGTWYAARASNGQLYKYSGYWYTISTSQYPGDTGGGGSSEYAAYPQEGKDSNGNLKGKPSESESKTLWKEYISWVINESTGSTQRLKGTGFDYRYQYGYRTLVMYMLYQRPNNNDSEDLWRVHAYPFQAVKDGMSLFTGFLDGLKFGDTLGLVSYATTAQREVGLWDSGAPLTVDLGDQHMTQTYTDIDNIQLHKQAAHYSGSTNIGDGVKEAVALLNEQARDGAQKTILLMTDGIVNKPNSLPSMPSGWSSFDWDDMTDWDNDGAANYNESDITQGSYDDEKRYLWYQVKQAVEAGFTINTFVVGDDADSHLMRAIAFYGGGQFMEAPGGSSVADLEDELLARFSLLASDVPNPELLAREH